MNSIETRVKKLELLSKITDAIFVPLAVEIGTYFQEFDAKSDICINGMIWIETSIIF
jgi:hypothetical protein